MHPMMNIAIRAAIKAGKTIINANYESKDKIIVSEKSKNNYVTNIDVNVENIIVDTLKQARPDDYFITEESGEFGNENSNYTWIIDPIDGTNNFIHRLPHNCVAICLQYYGETELAVIYNPHLDQLFTATKGGGAKLNDKKIRIASAKDFKGALISAPIKFSQKIFKNTYPIALLKLNEEISGYRYSGSIALDLCYLAAGYIDCVWTTRQSKIWDIAPGILIAKEAGALILDPCNDTEYNSKSKTFVAANSYLAQKTCKHLMPYILK